MRAVKIQESHVNATERHGIGEDTYDVAGTWLEGKTDGEIFHWFATSGDYGRCISKVYVDAADGPPTPVGWVFVKRAKYQDCDETYLHETWVTLLDRDETRHERDYHELQS